MSSFDEDSLRSLCVRASAAGLEHGLALRARGRRPLRVGAAEVDLALPAGTPVGGYLDVGPRGSQRPGQVHLTAVVLDAGGERVALVGIDAATVTPHLREALAARLPPSTRLVTSASHCHTGPGGLGTSRVEQLFLGPHDPALCARLVEAWLGCCAQAASRLSPACLQHGVAQASGLLVNRSDPERPVDATLDILQLDARAGEPIARLLAFAGHATLATPHDLLDGDYPAALRAQLSVQGPAPPVLFAAGATGSAALRPPPGPEPIAAAARALAELVQARTGELSLIEAPELALERSTLELPAPRVPPPCFGVLSEALSEVSLERALPVDLLRLGPVLVAVLPGELTAEVTAALREHYAGLGLHLALMSHNGTYCGYFMGPPRSRARGPEVYLEVYGPDTAQLFCALLRGVANGLTT